VARIFFDQRDLPGNVRRLFEQLDDQGGSSATEWTPLVDVIETPAGLEVVVDLPGVAASDIEVSAVGGALVIAGRKSPPGCERHHAAFHLVERSFGRFARRIPLAGAFDMGRADARLRGGELRILLPRVEERRGRPIRIDVRAER
jgi:HSP20 family protein